MKSNRREKMTVSKLARQLGVSRQLISAHRKKPEAPKLDDATGWAAFLAAQGRVGSAPPELRHAIAKARLEILTETKTKLARENAIAAKGLMSVEDAKRQNGEAWVFVFAELDRLCMEVSPTLAGLSAVEIYDRLNDFKETTRRNAKERFEKAA